MALVVFLRGVNVGGHRTFSPRALAEQLKDLKAVNIGAAGTFVIRRTIPRTQLRSELTRRLPFDTGIMICEGRELVRLMAHDPFAGEPARSDIVRFVSVLAERPRSQSAPLLPICFPSSDKWLLKLLLRENQFVLGVYRRQMKAIGYLGRIDRIFGAPATTRNWNTISAIVRALGEEES